MEHPRRGQDAERSGGGASLSAAAAGDAGFPPDISIGQPAASDEPYNIEKTFEGEGEEHQAVHLGGGSGSGASTRAAAAAAGGASPSRRASGRAGEPASASAAVSPLPPFFSPPLTRFFFQPARLACALCALCLCLRALPARSAPAHSLMTSRHSS